jgi:colanic acid biosynthesis glycosyl transferase WcaI
MSRILIWSPNYAPELTGIPPLVTGAAEWLAAAGHDVHVVAPVPNYPERIIHPEFRRRLWSTETRSGVKIHRHWLRVRPQESFFDKALYEVSSATCALPLVLRRVRSVDTVLCVVPTLTAAAYAATVVRRARLLLWVQDIVPDAAASVTGGKPLRAIVAQAAALERYSIKRADGIVVCSPGFADYFVSRGVAPERVHLLYNWVDLDWVSSSSPPPSGNKTRFLYAGNLGYTQGLETLIEAASQLSDDAAVEIVGAGNAAEDVRKLALNAANVKVSGSVPNSEFPQLLAGADVHVVMQRRVSAGANFPSKIATYMASGRPILASIDASTAAATFLRESGGAVLVEPESPTLLAEAMKRLSGNPSLRRELGMRSRAFAEQRLGRDSAMRSLEALLCH